MVSANTYNDFLWEHKCVVDFSFYTETRLRVLLLPKSGHVHNMRMLVHAD